jgi:phosphohistidine phosphatase
MFRMEMNTAGPMAGQRTLVVVRHAKSDWSNALPDNERPLAERGRRDAPAIGRWIAEQVGRVDLVLCSPAKRARQTWELAGAGLGSEPPIRHDDRIYTAAPAGLLGVLDELPDEAGTVVLVGHNPSLTDLVTLLSGESHELKTSAVAVLRWDGSWADVHARSARLDATALARG